MTVTRNRILELLEATSDVRKDKIAALKKAITEGTYRVKAEDIAEKILKEQLFQLLLIYTVINQKGRNN